MAQIFQPWHIEKIQIPNNFEVDEHEVIQIISDFKTGGIMPDIILSETGELIDGINALEAAKTLDQQVIIATINQADEAFDIQLISIEKIDPHPINSQIYGEGEDINSLAESIMKNGLQETFTLTPNGERFTIIHGHRRRLACLAAGIKTVPAKIKNFSSKEDEIAALLSGNEYREKSIEQKGREYLAWLDIEKERSRSRMSKPGTGLGTTRDILAQRVGLGSGVNAEKAVTAVKALDETRDAEPGSTQNKKHEQLKEILSKSRGVDAAYKLVKPPEKAKEQRWIPSENERVKVTGGEHQGKQATVCFLLSICAVCHIDGTPEEKREQIPFKYLARVQEAPTSTKEEINQQQQSLGLGKREQIFPSMPKNTGTAPTEQLQATATNLNVVGDALVGEVAIAILKLSPKQMHEVFQKIGGDLSSAQLEAVWQALSTHLAHKSAA